jgi:hypothetical protein
VVVSSDICIVVIEEIKLNPLERVFTLLSIYQKPSNYTVIAFDADKCWTSGSYRFIAGKIHNG